jgi:hypothetical protein
MPDPKTPPVKKENGIFTVPEFVVAVPGRSTGGKMVNDLRLLGDHLRSRPNTWAKVMESTRHRCSNMASAIKNNALGPRLHWEYAVRKHPGDEDIASLYVKYLGPPKRP